MASRRINVTLMVDIKNDNVDVIDDYMVQDIVNEYSTAYNCKGCEVDASLCEWYEEGD